MKILSNGRKKVQKVAKIFLVVFCVFALLLAGCSGGKAEYDFRETNWGMSRDAVKASESALMIEELEDVVFYYVKLYDQPFHCIYGFENGKLNRAAYIWQGTEVKLSNYILSFGNLRDVLIKEYGKPAFDKLFPEVQYAESGWQKGNTNIVLSLTSTDNDPLLMIFFREKG